MLLQEVFDINIIIMVRSFLIKQRDRYFQTLRRRYSTALKELLPQNPSIISNNCLGGFIYQDLNLPYLSPTAGLYFFFPDYIEFLKDIDNNIRRDITFVETSKYSLGNERISKAKHKYPIGLLGGEFEIHFLHYKNLQEAELKWKRRAERFNINNLVVLGTELDGCKIGDIKEFEALPFEKKVFLTKRNDENLQSVKVVKGFSANDKLGDPYRSGHILYKNVIEKLQE